MPLFRMTGGIFRWNTLWEPVRSDIIIQWQDIAVLTHIANRLLQIIRILSWLRYQFRIPAQTRNTGREEVCNNRLERVLYLQKHLKNPDKNKAEPWMS